MCDDSPDAASINKTAFEISEDVKVAGLVNSVIRIGSALYFCVPGCSQCWLQEYGPIFNTISI